MKKQFVLFLIFGVLLFSTTSWAQTGLNGIPVGSTTPDTGKFTNLEATTDLTLGADTITSFDQINDEKVKASTGDTSPGFLDSKIIGGTGINVDTTNPNQVTISSTGSGQLTTKGDVLIHDGNSETRLPVGSSGQYLTSDSNDNLIWANPPEGGQLFNANILLNAYRDTEALNRSPLKMVDGVVDGFNNETGVDTSTSTNEYYNASAKHYSPAGIGPAIQMAGMDASTDDYLNRGADLTGITDGKKGTVSFWFRPATVTGNQFILTNGVPERVTIYQSSNKITVQLRNPGGAYILNLISDPILEIGKLIHVFASWDLGVSKAHIYIDGVDETSYIGDLSNENIDYTVPNWKVGDRAGAANFEFKGDIGQLWFNTEYVDPAIDIDNFFDVLPVDMGSNGSTPTGNQPLIFLNNPLATWQNNLGTGGNFTEVGTITDGGTLTSGPYGDMGLISNSQTAQTEANGAHVVLFADDVDADIILNTELKAYVSRDNGTTFTQVTLSDSGEFENGNLLTGTVDISSQPSGTDMKWKVETSNEKLLHLHGVGLEWR